MDASCCLKINRKCLISIFSKKGKKKKWSQLTLAHNLVEWDPFSRFFITVLCSLDSKEGFRRNKTIKKDSNVDDKDDGVCFFSPLYFKFWIQIGIDVYVYKLARALLYVRVVWSDSVSRTCQSEATVKDKSSLMMIIFKEHPMIDGHTWSEFGPLLWHWARKLQWSPLFSRPRGQFEKPFEFPPHVHAFQQRNGINGDFQSSCVKWWWCMGFSACLNLNCRWPCSLKLAGLQ